MSNWLQHFPSFQLPHPWPQTVENFLHKSTLTLRPPFQGLALDVLKRHIINREKLLASGICRSIPIFVRAKVLTLDAVGGAHTTSQVLTSKWEFSRSLVIGMWNTEQYPMAGQFPAARSSTQGRASNVLAGLPPLNLSRLVGSFYALMKLILKYIF